MARFKIDLRTGNYPFELYVKTRWGRWRELEYFKTREEAVKYYELIKSLPEYLP